MSTTTEIYCHTEVDGVTYYTLKIQNDYLNYFDDGYGVINNVRTLFSFYHTREDAEKGAIIRSKELDEKERKLRKTVKYKEDKETVIVENQKLLKKMKCYNCLLKDVFEICNTDVEKIDYEKATGFDCNLIEKYFRSVLLNSNYPDEIKKEFECQYVNESNTIVINYWLPNIDDVPNVAKFKYDSLIEQVVSVKMKKKDFEQFYENVIFQMTLRTIYEVFHFDKYAILQGIVFNGWVKGVDGKTGNDFNSCVISIRTSRSEFDNMDFSRVIPVDCIKALKGLVAGPLSQLAPVKPIMNISREDSRFVESKEVINSIDSYDNLAEMDWEDFEHLIRELFEQIFSKSGGDVKVTQASRDGGVDAIAFDQDPIRGGKYVIQAKRYNNVVPVSAVRDLYGTVINEGAVKGILVTTSYFGNDSREFVKDKPITLIDGTNLIYLFQEYGHNFRIELRKK